MTEPIDTPPEGTPPEADAPASEGTDDAEQVLDLAALRKVRREAAALRSRLKEAEATHEADQARIAAYEKREAERAAAEVLVDPEDLWRYADAETQQQFIDAEFGGIVGDRVKEAAQAIIDARPHLGRSQRPPTAQPLEGLRPGASPEVKLTEPTWASVLRG